MEQKLTYIRCGDYFIPDIQLSYMEPIEWNRFSRRVAAYLQETNPMLYDDMVLTERLFPYLKEIGETANRRMEQLMKELLEKNPAPDKITQQLAWVQHMNSLKAQAEEIVNAELIFC